MRSQEYENRHDHNNYYYYYYDHGFISQCSKERKIKLKLMCAFFKQHISVYPMFGVFSFFSFQGLQREDATHNVYM